LVQALILVEFLLSYNTLKKKPTIGTVSEEEWKLPEADVGQNLLFSRNTNYCQVEWVTQIKKSIGLALRDAPDGPAFNRVVETVISRDKNWLRWKDDNCPPISRNPVEGDIFQKAKATAQSEYALKYIRANPMDSLDWTFLNEVEVVDGVEQLTTLSE
jgi:THO complex subunit 1